MSSNEFSVDLKNAAIYLRMPLHTVLKCVRYVARPNGNMRLPCRDRAGAPYFRPADLDAYLADLGKAWVDDHYGASSIQAEYDITTPKGESPLAPIPPQARH